MKRFVDLGDLHKRQTHVSRLGGLFALSESVLGQESPCYCLRKCEFFPGTNLWRKVGAEVSYLHQLLEF